MGWMDFVDKFGSGPSSDDGKFNSPNRIAVSGGLLYVVDRWNHRIQVFDKSTYAFVAKFGSYGSGDGQFDSPSAIAVTGTLIYVCDMLNYRVQVFNKSTYAFVAKFGSYGSGDGQFLNPEGVTIDESNSLVYVSDRNNHRIQIFDKTNNSFLGKFGSFGSGDGQLNKPKGTVITGNNLAVCDSENHRIQVFNRNTYVYAAQFNAGLTCNLSRPEVICSNGTYLYVADSGQSSTYCGFVFDVNTYECVKEFAQAYGSGDGQVSAAEGLCVDGLTYVADTGHHKIQIFGQAPATDPADYLYLFRAKRGWRA